MAGYGQARVGLCQLAPGHAWESGCRHLALVRPTVSLHIFAPQFRCSVSHNSFAPQFRPAFAVCYLLRGRNQPILFKICDVNANADDNAIVSTKCDANVNVNHKIPSVSPSNESLH